MVPARKYRPGLPVGGRRRGGRWSAPAHAGFDDQRNWGPDLVARPDGSVVMVFDHAQPDFSSRGWLTTWAGGAWSAPTPLTPDDPSAEIGSGHVAHGPGDTLAYVWIGKKMSPQHRFVARWRWFDGRCPDFSALCPDGRQGTQ